MSERHSEHAARGSLALVALAAELHQRLSAEAPSTAFARLLAGAGSVADEAVLPRGVRDSRILVAEAEHSPAGALLGDLAGSAAVHAELRNDRQVVAFVPEFPQHRQQRNAELLARRLQRRHSSASFGISSTITSARDLPVALAEAVDAMRLAQRRSVPAVFADDDWLDVSLERLNAALGSCLPLHNPLRVLADYDEAQGTQLVRTLRVWLRNNGDSASTARDLHVHANSLRYRLRRLGDVSGLRLDDPRARALAQLLLDQ